MNFLSHFYFDRHTDDCFLVLGTLLPDLLKNADKNIVLHPEKLQHPDKAINSIIAGWKKHLEVDRYFHSSDFFKYHSHQLKLNLLPALEGSPVKPFFLGHVAIELILDNLLLTSQKITVDDFYDHLNSCNEEVVYRFLSFCGMLHPEIFLRFFEEFKRSRYLYTYSDTGQVAYALKRICMRIWPSPFTIEQEEMLKQILVTYRTWIEPDFMQIFELIQTQLEENHPN